MARRAPSAEVQRPATVAGPGRPRSAKAEQSILRAAHDLALEIGFADLTMDAIAARAKVGKPTIYRRWPNKARLVLDAFLTVMHEKIAFRETGSARAELRSHMRRFVTFMNSPQGRIIASIIVSGQTDADLLATYRESWMKPRRASARRALQRGIDSGELRKDIDLDLAVDALYGPLQYRSLLKHQPLNRAFVDALIDNVMQGFSTR